MRVLTICAHPNPESFCHAVQRRFTDGLREAGHEVDSVDLHTIGFDPVFKQADYLSFLDETQLPDVEIIRGQLIAASGGVIRRKLAGLWLRNKPLSELLKLIAAQRPNDVQWHQHKVARAGGLVFIAPIFWMGFPAILKGTNNSRCRDALMDEPSKESCADRVYQFGRQKPVTIKDLFY